MLDKCHLLGMISLYVNLETAPGFASAAYIISIPPFIFMKISLPQEEQLAPPHGDHPLFWISHDLILEVAIILWRLCPLCRLLLSSLLWKYCSSAMAGLQNTEAHAMSSLESLCKLGRAEDICNPFIKTRKIPFCLCILSQTGHCVSYPDICPDSSFGLPC